MSVVSEFDLGWAGGRGWLFREFPRRFSSRGFRAILEKREAELEG
jgi:hypothetical protein